MHIKSIYLPERKEWEDGLGTVELKKLNKVVVLTGKNGSGKSRLLDRLYKASSVIPKEIAELREQINNIHNNFIPSLTMDGDFEDVKLAEIRSQQLEGEITTLKSYIQVDGIDLETLKIIPIVTFSPGNTEISDHRKFTKLEIEKMLNAGYIDSIHRYTFALIQTLQDLYYNVTHQLISSDSENKEFIEKQYLELQQLVKELLNTVIERSSTGDALLFGRPLHDCNLSNGQSMLLQMCVGIFHLSSKTEKAIFLIDEPENYIHPSALIEVIEKITSTLNVEQLWIATHSVSLVSYFHENSTIFFLDDSKIEYVGRTPEKVLHGLLGGENHSEKLYDFLGLPSTYAVTQFAYECLSPPTVVGADTEDVQTNQIALVLNGIKKDSTLKVLDFGAGKGRLISTIYEKYNLQTHASKERFNFIAYDVDDKDKQSCINALDLMYSNSSGRYYNQIESLLDEHQENPFDVVILCNVFHEIEPIQWLEIINSNHGINKLISTQGSLLIVEDTEMWVGEKAHSNGFLVLNTQQIKLLFNIEDDSSFLVHDARNNGKLLAHLIPQKYLQLVTIETIKITLEDVVQFSKSKVAELRNKGTDYKCGKKFAFYLQQYANAQLILDELNKSTGT